MNSSQRVVAIAAAVLSVWLAGCPSPERFEIVFEDLPAGLVSVWGSSAEDLWIVGGDPLDGHGPFVLRWDGEAWTRRKSGGEGDLWWVHGFASGPVFFGGANGQILQYRDGAFTRMQTPGTSTIFGIWGSAPDDVWAVGGDGQSFGVVWRYDGQSWKDAGVPASVTDGATVFKVWGTAANDVYLAGSKGTLLHYDGAAFSSETSPTTRTLFTVHAAHGKVAAVGGLGTATLLERADGTWTDLTPPTTPQLNGVWLTEDGGFAAGANATILTRSSDGWAEEDLSELGLNDDFHAIFEDSAGGVWAVGGQVSSLPLTRGMVVHRGPGAIRSAYDLE